MSANHIRPMKMSALSGTAGLRLALLLLAALLPAAAGRAQTVPALMAYQGWLTDGNGTALGSVAGPADYDVVFRIWNAQSGGAELYAEEQTVTVNGGNFSVLLGKGGQYGYNGTTEPFPPLANLFNCPTNGPLYIELTVQGVGVGGTAFTIQPRQQLLTAPYSFLAQNAVLADAAVRAFNLGTAANTEPVIVPAANLVTFREPLVATGYVQTPDLIVGGPGPATNTVMTVNGTLALIGPGVLTASGPAAMNALQAGTVNAAGNASLGGPVAAGSVAVTNNLAAAAVNVTGGQLVAGNLTVTNTLTAGTVTVAASLQVSSLTAGGPVQFNLGTTAQTAAGGDENLRVLDGMVNANSTISYGNNDFTCAYTSKFGMSENGYYVQFNVPFGNVPTVVATPVWGSNEDNTETPVLYGITATGFYLTFIDWSRWGDDSTSQAFHFLAVGPR